MMQTEPAAAGSDDPGVGVLLTVAGWTGGGVVTGILLQVARNPPGGGAFPTAHRLDGFFAVVAGCFLVGPLVAGALLWRWRQPRPVGTVATLAGVGVVALVPLMVPVGLLVSHGAALVGILLFVCAWGVLLPAGTRAWVLASTSNELVRDFEEPGALGFAPAAAALDPWTAPGPRTPVGVPARWAAAPSTPAAAPVTPVAAVAPGPPVDPSLPPVVLPPNATDGRPSR
ncbi:MAG: hypothetical protein JWM89_2524 [Acidimicrobiales bacterium]|nr:hypothetical protein [Acidimicrobiales bacterium]